MLNKLIKEKIEQLPEKIGVYIFLDKEGNVIYIGKASNIKKRVFSHFRNREDPKDLTLAGKTYDIKFVVTDSETEALVLEDILIKRHKPRYNARLKDDKTYPYIKITINEPFPSLTITREVRPDGSLYFGPYSNIGLIKKMIRHLRKIFPIRTCKIKISPDKKQRPCLDYHLKRCIAPCAGMTNPKEYGEIVKNFTEVLNGHFEKLIKKLKDEMFRLSREMKFEEAAKIRDVIKALEKIAEKQRVVLPKKVDEDVVGIEKIENLTAIFLIKVREGRIIGTEQFLMESENEFKKSDLISAFIKQYYIASDPPNKIIIPETGEFVKELEEIILKVHNKHITIDKAGNKEEYALIEMARENAKVYLSSEFASKRRKIELLKEIKEKFQIERIPQRIECFDISTLGGTFSVGSMVVFEMGSPRKSEYRRFKIRQEGKPDDYHMIKEVILRRFRRWPEKIPDLILIDGGKLQIKAVLDALEELNISNIPVLGLAKKFELIYTSSSDKPIQLPRDSMILKLFQNLRDEAHRFAITYHRKIRSKNVLVSVLDRIPGIGLKRKKAILSRFKTLDELRNATIEDLTSIATINEELAKRIKRNLEEL
ncbi:MAG: excinuclease ABC subunit UvrC [Candidatus Njordarchaeales archaeon]